MTSLQPEGSIRALSSVSKRNGAFQDEIAALSDVTRRSVLEQLGRADASITDLAEKFHMTLTDMKKHVGVLEQAGLVTTEKVGRAERELVVTRTCNGPARMVFEAWARPELLEQWWAPKSTGLTLVAPRLDQRRRW